MHPLNTILGSYMPSFFHMELSFPFPSTFYPNADLWDGWKEKEISIFIHEYIHFLQDISTYIGFNNAYVYNESIRGYVNTIYRKPQGSFNIPVQLPSNYYNIELNQFVNRHSIGSLDEESSFFIKKVKKKKVKVPFQSPHVQELTQVLMVSMKGKEIEFGSRAIMESMAYLMEKEITRGSSSAPDYPYNAAEIIIEHYYPEFGKDRLRVIALCDASMQFLEPGRIFIETLETFKNKEYLPTNANDVIDYFYNRPCAQMGEEKSLEIALLSFGLIVGEQLKSYMMHSSLKPFHNVVHTLIGFGLSERLSNRYFMLDIVREGYVSNNKLIKRYIRTIGTPIIRDQNDDYWAIHPIGKNQTNYWLDFFPAIEELYKCFSEGYTLCELYPWCEKSPHTREDSRCLENPWSRVSDTLQCPYAMLWRHWNLKEYHPKT